MKLVVFDTNVLTRAFTTRGLSADLFRLVVAEHKLLTGEVGPPTAVIYVGR